MPPNQQNQYDFIMNSNQKPKRGFNFGNTKTARIAVIAGGIILLIIVAVIVNTILSGGSKAQTQRLTEIAQSQSEIIRVSALADKQAKDIATRNFAVNTKLSIQSSQQDTKKLLANRGVKDKGLNKVLGASKNSKTDAALAEATKNNRFDETYNVLMTKQLSNYQQLLKSTFAASTPNEKKVLTAAFDNVTRLSPKQTAQNNANAGDLPE